MKRTMRLFLGGVVVAAALGLWCPASVFALEGQSGAAPVAPAAVTSQTPAVSGSVAPAVGSRVSSTLPVPQGASAAPAPPSAIPAPAVQPSAPVPPPGVWTVLTPVQPAASASAGSAAGPTAAPQTPNIAPAAPSATDTAAGAAGSATKSSAATSASSIVTSGANPGAPSHAATVQPAAATRPAAASTPQIAALSAPSASAAGPSHQSATPAASVPAAGGSTGASASGSASAARPTPGEIALRDTKDPAIVRDPYNWAVMAYKSHHELVVYFEGHLYKKYHAVFGRSLDRGSKEWSGDRRTPEGAYRIIRKHPDRRWRYFLQINYPNNNDRTVYDEMLADGEVPRIRGRAIAEGGAIGIHGTDVPILNSGNVNWTTGCISVDNYAIDELEALLPVGTLVVIKP